MANNTERYFQFPLELLMLPDEKLGAYIIGWWQVAKGGEALQAFEQREGRALTLEEMKAGCMARCARWPDNILPSDYRHKDAEHRAILASRVFLQPAGISKGHAPTDAERARQATAHLERVRQVTGGLSAEVRVKADLFWELYSSKKLPPRQFRLLCAVFTGYSSKNRRPKAITLDLLRLRAAGFRSRAAYEAWMDAHPAPVHDDAQDEAVIEHGALELHEVGGLPYRLDASTLSASPWEGSDAQSFALALREGVMRYDMAERTLDVQDWDGDTWDGDALRLHPLGDKAGAIQYALTQGGLACYVVRDGVEPARATKKNGTPAYSMRSVFHPKQLIVWREQPGSPVLRLGEVVRFANQTHMHVQSGPDLVKVRRGECPAPADLVLDTLRELPAATGPAPALDSPGRKKAQKKEQKTAPIYAHPPVLLTDSQVKTTRDKLEQRGLIRQMHDGGRRTYYAPGNQSIEAVANAIYGGKLKGMERKIARMEAEQQGKSALQDARARLKALKSRAGAANAGKDAPPAVAPADAPPAYDPDADEIAYLRELHSEAPQKPPPVEALRRPQSGTPDAYDDLFSGPAIPTRRNGSTPRGGQL